MDKKKVVKEALIGLAVVAAGVMYRWKVTNKGSSLLSNVDYIVAGCTIMSNDNLVQEVINETDSDQKVDKSKLLASGAAAGAILFSFKAGFKHFIVEIGYNGWRFLTNITKARINKAIS